MKIIKEYQDKYNKVTLFRSIVKGNFRFTIEVDSAVTGEVSTLEYTAESALEKFEELTLNYQYDRVIE